MYLSSRITYRITRISRYYYLKVVIQYPLYRPNVTITSLSFDEFLSCRLQKESDYSTIQIVYSLKYKDKLYGLIRIDRRIFEALLLILNIVGYRLELERVLTTIERLIYFLQIVRQGSSFYIVKSQFRRPLSSISNSFYYIIAALLLLYKEVVREPDYKAIIKRITGNNKFFLYFKDYVRALNSSYIKAYIIGESKPVRNRKGNLSQNILVVVVDLNILFTYVLAGQEGSIADVTILAYTRDIDNFRRNLPVRKYYLVDASYILLDIILIPYLGGVRYYLKEQL